jgi:hypothetical protein
MGYKSLELGQFGRASHEASTGQEIFAAIDHPIAVAMCEMIHAWARTEQADPSLARTLLEQAAATVSICGHPPVVGEWFLIRAVQAASDGNMARAARLLGAASDISFARYPRRRAEDLRAQLRDELGSERSNRSSAPVLE